MITNDKNDILQDTKPHSSITDAYKTVLYVELLDANDKCVYFGAVSRHGEVDHYGLFMSRLMNKDYEMKTEDLSKLYSLLPDEVQKKIITTEGLTAVPKKNYTGWIVEGVAVGFVIAFAIWFGIRKKKQK